MIKNCIQKSPYTGLRNTKGNDNTCLIFCLLCRYSKARGPAKGEYNLFEHDRDNINFSKHLENGTEMGDCTSRNININIHNLSGIWSIKVKS